MQQNLSILPVKCLIYVLQCKCKGSDEVKVITDFGCPDGGYPRCPTLEEMYCEDGTKLTSDYVMNREIERGITGCLCDDGVMPRLAQIERDYQS